MQIVPMEGAVLVLEDEREVQVETATIYQVWMPHLQSWAHEPHLDDKDPEDPITQGLLATGALRMVRQTIISMTATTQEDPCHSR